MNRLFNSKIDRRYQPPLLGYYFVDWEGDHPSLEPFYFLTNCLAKPLLITITLAILLQMALLSSHVGFPIVSGKNPRGSDGAHPGAAGGECFLRYDYGGRCWMLSFFVTIMTTVCGEHGGQSQVLPFAIS